jgi:hypothetical protein
VVRHGIPRLDSLTLRKLLEHVFTAGKPHMGSQDDEIRGKQRRRDLAAVGAVTNKRVHETGFLDRLRGISEWEREGNWKPYYDDLHFPAETRRRGFVLVRPAIARAACEREKRLRGVSSSFGSHGGNNSNKR